jgi:hypothetical protein
LGHVPGKTPRLRKLRPYEKLSVKGTEAAVNAHQILRYLFQPLFEKYCISLLFSQTVMSYIEK